MSKVKRVMKSKLLPLTSKLLKMKGQQTTEK